MPFLFLKSIENLCNQVRGHVFSSPLSHIQGEKQPGPGGHSRKDLVLSLKPWGILRESLAGARKSCALLAGHYSGLVFLMPFLLPDPNILCFLLLPLAPFAFPDGLRVPNQKNPREELTPYRSLLGLGERPLLVSLGQPARREERRPRTFCSSGSLPQSCSGPRCL